LPAFIAGTTQDWIISYGVGRDKKLPADIRCFLECING
jgi:hypothetical protein